MYLVLTQRIYKLAVAVAVVVMVEIQVIVKEVMADQVVVMLLDLLTLLQLVMLDLQIQIIQHQREMPVGSVDPTIHLVVEEDSQEQELAVVLILNLDQVVLA